MTLTINPNDDRVVMSGALRHAMFTHRSDASNYVQRANGQPAHDPQVALDYVAAERDAARGQLGAAMDRAGELGAALDVAQKQLGDLRAQVAAADAERAAAARVRAINGAKKDKPTKAEPAPAPVAPSKNIGQTAVGDVPKAGS